jgi:diguanylate cyclase (GGDEF)-like protein/PAS domain S-box-containing protein
MGAYGCMLFMSLSEHWIWLWFKVSSIGWITLPAFCLHFALLLTGKDRSMKERQFVLLYLPALMGIILIFTLIQPATLIDTSKLFISGYVIIRHQWFWSILTLYYCLYSITALLIIAKWGDKSVFQREKRQSQIIICSCLLVLLIFIIEFRILPFFGYMLPWIVMLAGLIWGSSILYAITKYKLMDLYEVLSLNDILTQVTDMVLLLDRSGNITLANDKACEILGYSKNQLLHMPLKKIIPHDDLSGISTANQNEMNMATEVSCQTSQAELIPIKVHFTSLTDNLGDIAGLLIIGQDLRLTKQLKFKIEEMNRVESALRESEAKFRNIYENAHDLIYMHDLNGRFLSVNKAAEKLLGYSEEELIHMNSLHVVVPEQRQMVIDMFNQQIIENQPVYYELTILNREGKRFDLDVSRRLIFETPEAVIYQCIARDITERKQMEERLRYLSMHDAMTGLYNRDYFTEELKRLESGRFEPVSIILCDLDNLKNVNDNFGHTAGDEMIITAARLIKSCFRSNDVVARFGGDEFAVIIPKSNETICLTLVNKIRTALTEHNKISSCSIGLSIGYAVRSDTKQTVKEVLKQADQAMYADKAQRKTFRA